MKPNRNPLVRAALATAITIVASQSLRGANGTWNVNANGDWGTATNWSGSTIADGSGSTANFVYNITGDRTVTLNSSRTLTTLTFTDATTASNNWILASSNSAVLTLAGTAPGFNVTNQTATISAPIAGTVALTKTGGGALILSGSNTFSAGITDINGILQLNNAAAAGTGAITVSTTTGAVATRLAINGGVTITNSVTVGATVGQAGYGSLQQTGTGQGRINGAITINGSPSAGGHFAGGAAVGSELVLAGAINSTVTGLTQRDGRVIYSGAGTGGSWSTLTVTNTALVGATNGIPTGVSVSLGGSGSATLDLNGYDQTLAGLTLGNTGSSFTSTINLGAKTLTLNGNITSQSAAAQTATHAINATTGGINVGSTARTINLPDTLAADEMLVTGATISGSGGIIKTGTGTLALKTSSVAGPLTINGGTLATGGFTDPTGVSISAGSLNFGSGATSLRMKSGTGGDLITTDSLTTNGTATVNIAQPSGLISNGTYPLISYTGTSPGLSGFSLAPFGHATASLVDTGSAIALQVTANDSIVWDGTSTDNWVDASANWKKSSDSSATSYVESDVVIFNDSPISANVVIASKVAPSSVTFNNTTATAYTLSGAGGIVGTTGLTKTADGVLTIGTPNAYSGATTINAGSVIANFTAGTAIPSASAISVASGASLTICHNGGTFALNNPTLTGSGTVSIDPGLTTSGNRDIANVTWNASAFSGPLNLAPTTGTMRLQVDSPADLGTGPIGIANGAQIIVMAPNLTFPQNFTIAGIGYFETPNNYGAIRAANDTTTTTTFSGTVTVSGSAKIGAMANAGNTGTALFTNTLTGGNLTFGGSVTNTSNETLAITGNAGGLTSLTVNDGLATGGTASITVNVGNGGTTGTIGSVPVTLKADGFKNAVLRYDRADGYTLANTITSAPSAPANEVRNYVDLDCTGTGFNDNGATITLGTAAPVSGGTLRIGQTRANALATLSGTLTGERLWVGSGQTNATLNLGSTAALKFNAFNLSEAANNSTTANHPAGANVEVVGQLRVGHYGTETSTYNLSGGTLALTGASPNVTPSTATGGATNATGDNNINAGATTSIHGGGVYIGIDGTGILNHSGGTLSTNWIVMDNRGDTPAGTNMPDGIDRYNMSGTALLKLKSTWGFIARNASTQVSLGGGTIQVDNTGVSGTTVTTGANINIPLDIPIDTVASTTTTLDTNASVNTGNAFTLTRSITGTGTLALTGGGAVNLSTTGFQGIAADLTSTGTAANLVKLGSGTTTLAGSMAGFTGTVTVSEGRLNIPASLNTAVTVGSMGTLAGEVALPSLTLDGGTLLFDPTTTGSLAVTNLNLASASQLDISAAPGAGVFTALTYSSKTGSGTLSLVSGTDYRTPPVVFDDGVSSVNVTFSAGKSLTWTGTASGVWDINGASNWTDGVIGEVFYSGDSVTFPTGATTTVITLAGPLAPAGVSVTADDTTNYTFNSSSGNQITGSTGITKSGTGTLTLAGPNNHSGVTTINGGVISINGTNSMGSGQAGNGIVLNGGKLRYTGTAALDLGVNRSITANGGGGFLTHSSGTAATISIPGSIGGSGSLAFQSESTAAGTFDLTGNNASFTGAITVDALSTGLTTLRIGTASAAPAASSITLNYPAAGATGNANTLFLAAGTVLPAGTTLNMNSFLTSGGLSLRTQVTSPVGAVTINGPVRVAGNTIVQFSAAAGGTMTLNGSIGEISPGSFVDSASGAFTNVLFLRGNTTSTHIVNGQINLPSAGSTVAVTDGATAIINSTGNDFKSASAAYGTLRIGATNAIPTTARLVIGQTGNQTCTFDLNGFDQTVSGLEWQAINGNTLTKGISNSHPTNVSTFTINQVSAPLASYNGTISGNVNLVKDGSATTTLLASASNYTGNVTVNAGQLTISASHNDTNSNSALGVTNVGTRSVTIKSGATLAFTGNDNLGNAASSPVLPIIVEAGGTLTNAGFNTMGPLTLNGGTMAATGGANSTFQSYRLFGTVTAGGTAASTMTATGTNSAYHLHSTTAFNVANATADAAADLTVSAPLINQSGTQASAAGNLVKDGAGTLSLAGVNTYTGNTTVNAGTLQLASTGRLRFVIGASSGSNNSLTGAGDIDLDGGFVIDTTAAAALTTGSWTLENVPAHTGAYASGFKVYNTDGSAWADAGSNKWTKPGAIVGTVWSFDEVTGVLSLAQSGYSTWAATNAPSQTAAQDYDGDGVSNGVEYVLGGTKNTNDLSKLPAPATSGGNLTFTFIRDRNSISPDTAVEIQVGTTLATWPTTYPVPSVATPSGAVTVTDNGNGTDTVVLTITRAPDAAKFARLKVTVQ